MPGAVFSCPAQHFAYVGFGGVLGGLWGEVSGWKVFGVGHNDVRLLIAHLLHFSMVMSGLFRTHAYARTVFVL